MIPSEAQAEQIGERLTGGKRDHAFIVFRYTHNRSNLTLFGVETFEIGNNRIITRDPSAAVSARPVTEGRK